MNPNPNQILEKLITNKSVAIVGPSSSLDKKNLGKEIDSHDIVIRFNRYTVLDKNDCGSKVDILMHNFYVDIPVNSEPLNKCQLIISGHDILNRPQNVNNFNKSVKVFPNIPHIIYDHLQMDTELKKKIIKGIWKTTGFWTLCLFFDKINLMKELKIYGVDFCFNKYNNTYNPSKMTPGHNLKYELSLFKKQIYPTFKCDKINFTDENFLKYLEN